MTENALEQRNSEFWNRGFDSCFVVLYNKFVQHCCYLHGFSLKEINRTFNIKVDIYNLFWIHFKRANETINVKVGIHVILSRF